LRSWLEGNLWSDVSRSAPCNVLRVSPDTENGVFIPLGGQNRGEVLGHTHGYVNPIGDAVS
jgi:hypothetical protein